MPSHCPTCQSPRPWLHPVVGATFDVLLDCIRETDGEVVICKDAFHAPRVRCHRCKTPWPDPKNHTGCCDNPGCNGTAECYV